MTLYIAIYVCVTMVFAVVIYCSVQLRFGEELSSSADEFVQICVC